ncbi:hypothetical protein MesoLjLc_50980 [Mesorhizobium sp. L-8-10]|uniref:hypothetical protein n=1 Tax=Mesorhizobium sp. L-8-10 TaxID=2744523 RepID=UPI001928247A|nr:hypothetical protein [Mesorhizobium sp. L-8-10]BCH33168.1 hypothetical protein MesoLjLc_50980 [Mesorhizobium sp. L-8-10]
MSTHSKDGREWAKLSQLKLGDRIATDGDFTCGISNKTLAIERDDHGLYVPCDEGNHYLDGQADDGEHLVGIWPAE